MPRDTFRIPVRNPEVMQWMKDHDLDPVDIMRTVTIDEDGAVHLKRMLRDEHGKRYAVGDEVAAEPVVVLPSRPFPMPPGTERPA